MGSWRWKPIRTEHSHLEDGTEKHRRTQPCCSVWAEPLFCLFTVPGRSAQIAAGGKQRKRLTCFVRGAGRSAEGFPFPKPTTALAGSWLRGQPSAPGFGGCQRGDKARALCERAGVGGRAGCAGRACQPSCTTPPGLAPVQDASLIKGHPECPAFPLSPREMYTTLLPTPASTVSKAWLDPAPCFSDHTSGQTNASPRSAQRAESLCSPRGGTA